MYLSGNVLYFPCVRIKGSCQAVLKMLKPVKGNTPEYQNTFYSLRRRQKCLVVNFSLCFERMGNNCEYEHSKVGSANLQT
jgi:hypothetical protein